MVTISNESKNNLSVTNQTKTGSTITWNQAVYTWDESKPGTWNIPRLPITRESKNNLSVSNESKN